MNTLTKLFIAGTTAMLATVSTASAVELTDEDVYNLVKRSYQYVAMYNVNNKAALKQGG